MPTVGKGKNVKHFPYTASGKAAAKMAAEKTGKPMETLPEFHKKRMKGKG